MKGKTDRVIMFGRDEYIVYDKRYVATATP